MEENPLPPPRRDPPPPALSLEEVAIYEEAQQLKIGEYFGHVQLSSSRL
jgi:hypothetical protein